MRVRVMMWSRMRRVAGAYTAARPASVGHIGLTGLQASWSVLSMSDSKQRAMLFDAVARSTLRENTSFASCVVCEAAVGRRLISITNAQTPLLRFVVDSL